ncbi:MAG: hypothetical protein IKL82_00520 [Clostridia bacterium]|nr:hypothetical protein [Clostridia bacterium]
MITLENLNLKELGAELGVLAVLNERVEDVGFHFTLDPNAIAKTLNISDSTVRRTLKKYVELNIIKMNNEVWANPAVFDGGYFERRAYNAQKNTIKTKITAQPF